MVPLTHAPLWQFTFPGQLKRYPLLTFMCRCETIDAQISVSSRPSFSTANRCILIPHCVFLASRSFCIVLVMCVDFFYFFYFSLVAYECQKWGGGKSQIRRVLAANGLMAQFEGLIYFIQLMTELTSLAGLTQGRNLAVEHCTLKAAEHVHFILLTRPDKVWIANVNFGGL